MSVATARPDSSRNRRSTTARASVRLRQRPRQSRWRRAPRSVGSRSTALRARDPAASSIASSRFGSLDQVEAAERLLGLRERPIGRDRPTVADADRRRGRHVGWSASPARTARARGPTRRTRCRPPCSLGHRRPPATASVGSVCRSAAGSASGSSCVAAVGRRRPSHPTTNEPLRESTASPRPPARQSPVGDVRARRSSRRRRGGASTRYRVGMANAEGDPPSRRSRGHRHQPATRSSSREAGHTKLDLVRYYLAVADGALRGVARPADGAQALRRRRRRASLLPEAGAREPARLASDRRRCRSRPAGPPTRSSSTTRPGSPGSSTSAASTSTRTRSAPTTSTIPTSCGSTSTRCRAWPGRRSATSRSSRARRSTASGSSAGRRRPARAASTSTSASSRAGRYPRGAPRGAGARARRRAAGARRSPPRSGGRRSATASSSTTTRTPRTGRSPRPTRSGRLPDARVSMPLRWDEVADVEAEDFTLATVPALYAERGDAGAGIDEAVGSLEALLELSARARGGGPGRRAVAAELPQAGRASRRGSSRRRQRRADADYDTPEAEAEREKTRAAMERRFADADVGPAPRPTPTGRRTLVDPGHRDLPGGQEGRRPGRPRALEGTLAEGGGGARAGRRPRRLDAWTVDDVDARPGQPDPRPRGRPAATGTARSRLRPADRVSRSRPRGLARTLGAGQAGNACQAGKARESDGERQDVAVREERRPVGLTVGRSGAGPADVSRPGRSP